MNWKVPDLDYRGGYTNLQVEENYIELHTHTHNQMSVGFLNGEN